MKYFVVFSLVVVTVSAALDAEFKEKAMAEVQKVGAECAKQENANEDDVGEILARKLPSRKEGKCTMACFNQKFEVQDKDGKMSLEGALKTIEAFKVDADIYEKMKQLLETCIPEVGDTGDRCENAYKMAECGHRICEKLGLRQSLLM